MNFVRRWLQGSGAAEGEEAAHVPEKKEEETAESEPADDAQIADENPPAEDDEAEKEAWAERTAVITRYDHEINCDLAKQFIEEVANLAVDQSSEQISPKKLPDLVPEVQISEPAENPQEQPEQVEKLPPVERPASSQNEDSEYESADELPLQDTLYLDPTANTLSTPTPESVTPEPPEELPKDEEPQGTDVLDSTVVLETAAEVPESPKEEEIPPPSAPADSEPAAPPVVVGNYQTRPQLFSPSSASDVSAVESDPDFSTHASVSRSASGSGDPARNDLELELISKFEQLALDKQQQQLLETSEPVSQAVEQIPTAQETSEFFAEPVEPTESVVGPAESEAPEPLAESAEIPEERKAVEAIEEVADTPVEPVAEASENPVVVAELAEPVAEVSAAPVEVADPVEPVTEVSEASVEIADPVESVAEVSETPVEIAEPLAPVVVATEVSEGPTEPVDIAESTQSPESTETVDEEQAEAAKPVDIANEPESVVHEEAPVEQVTECESKDAEVVEDPEADSKAVNQEPVHREPVEVVEEPAAPERISEQSAIKEEVSEEPVIPKKGYDLSFLDRLDDAEFATPPGLKPGRGSQTPQKKSPEAEKPADTKDSVAAAVEPVNPPSAVLGEEAAQVCAEVSSTPVDISVETQPVDVKEEANLVQVPPLKEEISSPVPSAEEEIPLPKKGYDLSFLDKLDDLGHAAPPGLPAAGSSGRKPVKKEVETEMKEKAETESTPDEQATSPSQDQKNEKKVMNRKPIRPRIARPVAAAGASAVPKKDPFEVEFAFDPNEDPFKPKAKLAASPPRGDIEPASSAAKPNHSLEQDRFENGESSSQVALEFSDQLQQQMDEEEQRENQQRLSAALAQEEFRPAGEVFQDPSDLDFLLQHGGSSKEIALARQSLFVKFDPLVGGRPSLFPTRSDNSVAEETVILEEKDTRASGSESLFLFSPPHGSTTAAPAASNVTDRRAEKIQCHASDSEPSSAPQRLVSGDVVAVSEHKEALKLQELLFQDRLLQKDREIQAKEKEAAEVRTKLESTMEAQAQMRQIVGEYEKTISQLIAEKEREKANMEQSLQNTVKERDQAIEDLKEVERAFSEFHRMYERNRAAAEGLHKNEEALKKAMAAYQERLQQEQHKYETLKLHAAQKLEGAQQEMENMKRTLEAETSRVKAVLKKTEMRLASVEMTLDQKTKENEELTKLCDELINKLGSGANH